MTRTDGLRAIVEALDREMARFQAVRGAAGADPTALISWWAKLVERLGLAPPPELRACPSCGGLATRAARRCDRCGRGLEPLAPDASA